MQRHFLLITAAAICVGILVVLLNRPTNFFTDSSSWRNLMHQSPPRIAGDYEAPCHLCDRPTCKPNEWIVFLHLGYSLEQHKQAIGNDVDLDSAIKNIFPEQPTSHGLYYAAELHNTSLAAVRADIGVDMVECNFEVSLIGFRS